MDADKKEPEKGNVKAVEKETPPGKEISNMGETPAKQDSSKTEGMSGKQMAALGVGAALGAGVTAAALPPALTAVGFTKAGIAAGTMAAGMMSSAATAAGGGVAAGSTVAVLQSAGAAGVATSTMLGAAAAGAAGGAGAGVAVNKILDNKDGKPEIDNVEQKTSEGTASHSWYRTGENLSKWVWGNSAEVKTASSKQKSEEGAGWYSWVTGKPKIGENKDVNTESKESTSSISGMEDTETGTGSLSWYKTGENLSKWAWRNSAEVKNASSKQKSEEGAGTGAGWYGWVTRQTEVGEKSNTESKESWFASWIPGSQEASSSKEKSGAETSRGIGWYSWMTARKTEIGRNKGDSTESKESWFTSWVPGSQEASSSKQNSGAETNRGVGWYSWMTGGKKSN